MGGQRSDSKAKSLPLSLPSVRILRERKAGDIRGGIEGERKLALKLPPPPRLKLKLAPKNVHY